MSWQGRSLRAQVRAPRTLVWAGLLAGLSIIFAFTPLFNTLGFEFCFALALAVSFAGADLSCAYVRRARATERQGLERAGSAGHTVAKLTASAAAVSLALLLPPLLIITLNAIRVRNCDFGFGLIAFVLLPVMSALVATAVGVVTGLAAGQRRRLSNALPLLLVLFWLGRSAWQFYAQPPVFAYNAFGGYFPGNLYDENIQLGAPLMWVRAMELLLSLAALGTAALLLDLPSLSLRWLKHRRPLGSRTAVTATAAVAAAIGCLLWLRAGELGFAVDATVIQTELGGRIETEHFVIYYPADPRMQRRIGLIAEDHEFRYAQATRAFGGVEPAGKVHSYYFASGEQKRRLFGAERVHMAKPWRREIFLNDDAFPHPIARHEIAHVVAGAFGDPVFGASIDSVAGLPVLVNVGLIEGAAVAADWPGRYRGSFTPHQSVRAMLDLGFAPPIEKLLSPGFFQFSAGRSYTTAGSFVRYLLDSYGAERFRQLYRSGGDFRAAYGRPLAALAADWRQMINGVQLPEGAAEQLRERFRGRSILHRPCPHAIARRRKQAAEQLHRGDRTGAIRTLRRVCRDDPGEPRWQLDLAAALLDDDQLEAGLMLYRDLADDTELSSTMRTQALLELADAAGRDRNLPAVVKLLDEAEALPVGDDERRVIAAKRAAATHAGAAGDDLRAYFWGRTPKEEPNMLALAARAAAAAAAEPGLALGSYLFGRVLFISEAFEDALPHLERAAQRGLPDPLMVRENARIAVVAAYRTGQFALAQRYARILTSPEQPEIIQLLGQDWLERVHWKRTGKLLPDTD